MVIYEFDLGFDFHFLFLVLFGYMQSILDLTSKFITI